MVEHSLGKGEVESSILSGSTNKINCSRPQVRSPPNPTPPIFHHLEIRRREEFPAVPRQIEQTGADALAFLGGPAVLGSNPKDTIAPAATTRLPAIFSFRRYAAAGGLLSFGASLGGLVRRLGKVRRQDPERRQAR